MCSGTFNSAAAAGLFLLLLGGSMENKAYKNLVLNPSKVGQYTSLTSVQSPSSRLIPEEEGLESCVKLLLVRKK